MKREIKAGDRVSAELLLNAETPDVEMVHLRGTVQDVFEATARIKLDQPFKGIPRLVVNKKLLTHLVKKKKAASGPEFYHPVTGTLYFKGEAVGKVTMTGQSHGAEFEHKGMGLKLVLERDINAPKTDLDGYQGKILQSVPLRSVGAGGSERARGEVNGVAEQSRSEKGNPISPPPFRMPRE